MTNTHIYEAIIAVTFTANVYVVCKMIALEFDIKNIEMEVKSMQRKITNGS